MKLALICTEDLPVPAVAGGAIQITVDELSRRLARHHDVWVYSVQSPQVAHRPDGSGVNHVRFPRARYLQEVVADLRRLSPDVIVVFNRPAWMAPVRRACPRSRLVLSLHTHRMDPAWTAPRIARRAVRAADAIVAVSRFLARRLVRRYPAAARKVRVVYSGVDTERFRPAPDQAAARVRFGVEGSPVVLFSGRLTRAKGVHVLLRAIALLRRRHPRLTLLVVGSRWFHGHRPDAYVRALRRAARRLGDRVRFTGFIPPDRVHEAFQAADVLACPSQWHEPLARVLYEAMACGLPVVTTARGGNPEVVRSGWNGWVVRRWRSPRAFARALAAALRPSFRARAGERGRRLVLLRHTWEAAAHRWLRVLAPEPAGSLHAHGGKAGGAA